MKQSTVIGIVLSWIVGTVFFVLKVFEIGAVANWHWFWVLAPFWVLVVAVQVAVIIKIIILNIHINSKKGN